MIKRPQLIRINFLTYYLQMLKERTYYEKIFQRYSYGVLLFSTIPQTAFAAEEDSNLPFSCQVYSEKQSYEEGEEIKITTSVKNTSLDEYTDMRIWLDYPKTEYYLTPGATERFVESFNDYYSGDFRILEDEGVLNFASKFDSVKPVRSFFLWLAHAYKTLTLAFTTVKYSFQHFFISVGQQRAEPGTVKVFYDNTEIEFTVKCRYSVKKSEANEALKTSTETGLAGADIKAVENSYTGLAFAMSPDNNSFGLFVLNPDIGKACIYMVDNGKYSLLGTKSVDIKADTFYRMKVLFNNNRVLCYLVNNTYDTDPYPVFDTYYESKENGYGVFCKQDGYRNFDVAAAQIPQYEKTYTNPVYENAPDPYILKENGTYYLYATTATYGGFLVSSSTDLVNWHSLGFCAKKGDIYGNSDFWAPEVYKYQGKYYLLYSTDEHIALAVSDSPAGPFVKTSDGYLLEDKCIDGHFLFDDDGSIYLYMAYWGKTGEEIWGCRMKSDLSGIIPDTMAQLTSCKSSEGGVNEGPFMLKYQGRYYLTYSVNGYTDHNYSVKLAVSDSPLGDYAGKGTILEKTGPLVGTGHHSFTTSPDGSELIIAYHCHYSTTRIHERKLCIDRCRFVQTSDGYSLSVYGPTATSQPYPQ